MITKPVRSLDAPCPAIIPASIPQRALGRIINPDLAKLAQKRPELFIESAYNQA